MGNFSVYAALRTDSSSERGTQEGRAQSSVLLVIEGQKWQQDWRSVVCWIPFPRTRAILLVTLGLLQGDGRKSPAPEVFHQIAPPWVCL